MLARSSSARQFELNCCRSLELLLLPFLQTEPGLFVIVEAVIGARTILQCMTHGTQLTACCLLLLCILQTEPGLSVIVEAVIGARKIFQRMTTYAKYTVAMTFRICFTFGILTIAYNW